MIGLPAWMLYADPRKPHHLITSTYQTAPCLVQPASLVPERWDDKQVSRKCQGSLSRVKRILFCAACALPTNSCPGPVDPTQESDPDKQIFVSNSNHQKS